MTLINSIKSKLRSLKAIVGSLAGGENAIKGDPFSNDGNVSIQKEVESNRLGEHLVNGEITQEVVELRYSTYEVSEESKNYKYIGDGQAIKQLSKATSVEGNISFYQENRFNTETVLDGMMQAETNNRKRGSYTLNVTYSSIPRFRVESNVKSFKFVANKSGNRIELYIDTLANGAEASSKPFINEMEKLVANHDKHAIERSDIGLIESITFVTNNANGEKDLMSYILCGLSFSSLVKEPEKYILTISVDNFTRSNLTDKFYSKEMAEKYAQKAPKKQNPVTIKDIYGVEKCPLCGEPMQKLDAYVIKEEIGERMCHKCYEKRLLSQLDE